MYFYAKPTYGFQHPYFPPFVQQWWHLIHPTVPTTPVCPNCWMHISAELHNLLSTTGSTGIAGDINFQFSLSSEFLAQHPFIADILHIIQSRTATGAPTNPPAPAPVECPPPSAGNAPARPAAQHAPAAACKAPSVEPPPPPSPPPSLARAP